MTYQPSTRFSGVRTSSGISPFHRTGMRRAFTSNLFALAGALVLGVLIPQLLRPWIMAEFGRGNVKTNFSVEVAIIGSILAIIVGHLSLARFTSLPTIRAKTYVLPSFLVGYGPILSGLYLSNILFGRYHFAISFLVVVPWYFLIAVLRARWIKTRVAIIGEAPARLTAASPSIEWFFLREPVLTEEVSAIIVDPRSPIAPEWEHFIAQAVLEGIPVHDARYMLEVLTNRVEIRHMTDNNFGSLLPGLYYIRIKRFLDVVTAIPALILAAPVIAVFGLLVRAESSGPAIFRQTRTGFRGRPFTCYKLRSMREGHSGPHFTHAKDQRITRVGAFIRKYHIDELPQIFNVLKGEMSWIGPRPEAIQLADRYEQAIPYYVYRHAVSPGITGWAAVHQGNVAEIDAATIKLQYDFFYIKYCSLWLDVLVILKSVRTILTGFGSR